MGSFHNLPYQEAEGLFLASLEVRNGLRIGSNYFVYQFTQFARVADLFQAQLQTCLASLLDSTPLSIKFTSSPR